MHEYNCVKHFKQYPAHSKCSRFAVIHAFPSVALVQLSRGKFFFGGHMGKKHGLWCPTDLGEALTTLSLSPYLLNGGTTYPAELFCI